MFPPIHDRSDAAEQLQEHLKLAGVTSAELFAASERRLPLRAHDLRANFITIGLANGRMEAWITDRTGHTSSQMLYRYKRFARHASESGLGDFAPLDQALPELRPASQQSRHPAAPLSHDLSHAAALQPDSALISSGSTGTRTPDLRIKRTAQSSEQHENTYGNAEADASRGLSKPVETTERARECSTDAALERLSRALEAAALAGQWEVVRRLTDALERLQGAARADAAVIDLDAHRGKRGAP